MKLFTMGANGKYSQGDGTPHLTFNLQPNGQTIDISLDGNPEIVCQMVFDSMEKYPEVAKVVLTTVYQFMRQKGITSEKLIDHTFFKV